MGGDLAKDAKRTTIVRYIYTNKSGEEYSWIFYKSEEDCLGFLEGEKGRKKRLDKYR